MAYIVHPTELKDLLAAAKEENKGKGIPDDVLIQWILNNKDIKIMTSSKYGESKPIAEWAEENMDDLPKYFSVTEDEEGNVIGQDDKPEVSKEDKIKYAKEFNTGEYKNIWDKYMADYDETAPVLERAKKLTDTYRALWREKNDITSKYDSGIGQNDETYQSALKAINDALEYAEKSDELKDIISDIESNGTSFWQNLNNPVIASTLKDMATHSGSQLNNAKQQFQNWITGDVYNSKLNRAGGYTDMEDIPELYHKYNEAYDNLNNWILKAASYCAENGITDRKKILDMINKTDAFNGFAKSQKEKLSAEILDKVKTGNFEVEEKGEEGEAKGEEGEAKGNNKEKPDISGITKTNGNSNVPAPYRPIKQVTDEMNFGDDVAAAGGNEYLEGRNKILAEHLKLRGIKSEEDIDKYLSQYPSWKNAKEDWKANTKKILSEKIKGLEGEGQSEDKVEENKEDNVSKEEVNEIIEENKEAEGGEQTEEKGDKKETLKDKINKGVNKFKDILENPDEYIDEANDFLSKLQPDDESPLNGEEGNEVLTEPMFDKNGKIVGEQRSDAYLYDKHGKPIGSKKSDKYIYDKNGYPVGSKRNPSNEDSINGVEDEGVEDEVLTEPMFDKNGKVVGEQRSEAYLYDKHGKPIGSRKSDKYIYDKNGRPVGSKWTPSNDDSINGVEDDEILTEPMFDKNGKVVGEQRSDAYLYDKSGKPIGSKKSDKYLYDKNGKVVGSKAPKKEEKKEDKKEKEVTTEPMFDKNGKIVGEQRSDAYLYDKSGKPIGSKKSDKYIYDKKGNPVGSKSTKKEDKKEGKKFTTDDVKKAISSPTIMNLLKKQLNNGTKGGTKK